VSANDNTKTAAYENYPNNPLTQASLSQLALGTTTVVRTLECNWMDKLVLEAVMTTDAAADMAVAVWPVGADGVSINNPLTASPTSGPTLVGGKVYFTGEYDVTAQDRVQVRVTNNDPVSRDLVCTAKLM
jgi:hypothetical protein